MGYNGNGHKLIPISVLELWNRGLERRLGVYEAQGMKDKANKLRR